MQDTASLSMATLESHLTERYGLLLSQTHLAALLGRTTGGLRYIFAIPATSRPET